MKSKRWVYVKCDWFDTRQLSDAAYSDYFRAEMPRGHTVQLVKVERLARTTSATAKIYTKISLDEMRELFSPHEYVVWEDDPMEILAKAIK